MITLSLSYVYIYIYLIFLDFKDMVCLAIFKIIFDSSFHFAITFNIDFIVYQFWHNLFTFEEIVIFIPICNRNLNNGKKERNFY